MKRIETYHCSACDKIKAPTDLGWLLSFKLNNNLFFASITRLYETIEHFSINESEIELFCGYDCAKTQLSKFRFEIYSKEKADK